MGTNHKDMVDVVPFSDLHVFRFKEHCGRSSSDAEVT